MKYHRTRAKKVMLVETLESDDGEAWTVTGTYYVPLSKWPDVKAMIEDSVAQAVASGAELVESGDDEVMP